MKLGRKTLVLVFIILVSGTALGANAIKIFGSNNFDLSGSDIVDGGTTVWDASNGYVPKAQIQSLTASDVGLGNVENQDALAQDGSEIMGGDLDMGHFGLVKTNYFKNTGDIDIISDSDANGGGSYTYTISGNTGSLTVPAAGGSTDGSIMDDDRSNNYLDLDAASSAAEVKVHAGDSVILEVGSNTCTVDSSGNLNCDGTKSWIHSLNATHETVYTSQESPQVRAVYEGQALVTGGKVNISLPNHFSETISDTEPSLMVQATPHELATVAVTDRTDDYLVIEASKDVQVDYRVTGIREGYEDKQVVRNKNQ